MYARRPENPKIFAQMRRHSRKVILMGSELHPTRLSDRSFTVYENPKKIMERCLTGGTCLFGSVLGEIISEDDLPNEMQLRLPRSSGPRHGTTVFIIIIVGLLQIHQLLHVLPQ